MTRIRRQMTAEGRAAFAAGLPVTACPYGDDAGGRHWRRAWAGARKVELVAERTLTNRRAKAAARLAAAESAIVPPVCPACGQPAKLQRNSAALYGGRDWGPVWLCRPCWAWVGCHPGGIEPLGVPANGPTRAARHKAHLAFDPLWEAKVARDGCSRNVARAAGYRWLGEQLGIEPARRHIGMLTIEECKAVVALCRRCGGRKPQQEAA